jgi:hypothetical protein
MSRRGLMNCSRIRGAGIFPALRANARCALVPVRHVKGHVWSARRLDLVHPRFTPLMGGSPGDEVDQLGY